MNSFAFGAAPPSGWSIGKAIRRSRLTGRLRDLPLAELQSVADSAVRTQETLAAQLLRSLGPKPRERTSCLDKVPDLAAWAVRHQGHRSTCTAFAVVAAEELADLHALGVLPRYSEEDLYHAMRAVLPSSVVPDLTGDDDTRLDRTGETFLAQAAAAIRNGGLIRNGRRYRKDRILPVNHVEPVRATGGDVANMATPFEVGVAGSAQVVPAIDWGLPAPPPDFLIETFHNALSQGRPVVVALPVLEDPGHQLFTSRVAQLRGRVVYPSVADLREDHRAIGGHAICIVGYEPSTDGGDGWFVFRNSFGDFDFARKPGDDPALPRAPAPGYGVISAADVDRWCWEYMLRA